ncbi:hypothetical protein EVAR_74635_1 [Eumeta japonica]|uniref:Uncharacterized protein n=1 Tax=Eumeta variegata TaxID=151549 RepID=A0A4C1WB56_EUMVA|nr:hypothetical protein EVAR_74635_1 [Eumeta japonica]
MVNHSKSPSNGAENYANHHAGTDGSSGRDRIFTHRREVSLEDRCRNSDDRGSLSWHRTLCTKTIHRGKRRAPGIAEARPDRFSEELFEASLQNSGSLATPFYRRANNGFDCEHIESGELQETHGRHRERLLVQQSAELAQH